MKIAVTGIRYFGLVIVTYFSGIGLKIVIFGNNF
jgi:hypothetical protein